ncbi:MAG: PD40 domain-containing protein [Candidatus Dormibacteraeota bacterium]|nr:PD40 domain-containing protein [Candidatus Dormibacteraeota bacterium]MBO0703803.1 PD40 domain-containing protein [Candidatus Dormibacteraeota bacterium]MBO0760129.1 PD40 domain-containing protein [Candidatus Dormibacteraeota bacterium]
MIGRWLTAAGLLVVMVAFGVGVYFFWGTQRHGQRVGQQAMTPDKTKPKLSLPGTLIVAQGGTLYRMQSGSFKAIASGGWTQPAALPDHQHLVAVKRGYNSSDLFLLDTSGKVLEQLTQNASGDVPQNHWSFYPRVTPDGRTLFYDYDEKTCNGCYQVDLSIFAMPMDGSQNAAHAWTQPNAGTGGDVQPQVAPGGGIVYAKYALDPNTSQMFSQLWLNRWAGSPGMALTSTSQNCNAPAVSPDGKQIAMICSQGGQTTQLVVAPVQADGSLGQAAVVAKGVIASPAWSPDGRGLLYLQPEQPTGHFQLFYMQVPPAPSPGRAAPAANTTPAPQEVTDRNDFDATSPPAWF